jgi:hypothetical protein
MQNYRVTQNYKLSQIEGYTKLVTSIAAKDVQGQWYGKIGNTYYHLVACNGYLNRIFQGAGGGPIILPQLIPFPVDTNADTVVDGWTCNGASKSVAAGGQRFTADTQYDSFANTSYIRGQAVGDVIYVTIKVNSSSASVGLKIDEGTGGTVKTKFHTSTSRTENLSLVATVKSVSNSSIYVADDRAGTWTETFAYYPIMFNLTSIFGAGNEPNVTEMDYILSYYYSYANVTYFTGTGTSIVTPVPVGSLANAPTYMFFNNSKVYIQDGTNYKSYDGTSLIDVVGYVPTVMTSTTPAGVGTLLEGINLLNGQKIQKFNGNAAATVFQLMETAITSVDSVYVGGVLQTVTTHYTVSTANGTVSPVTPANWGVGTNNVIITWTKTSTANRAEIASCRKAINFGTRIHVWGNRNTGYENNRWHSGLVNAITSAEYFPATQTQKIGPDEFAISDIVTQYDRQVIFTNGGRSYYSYYEVIDDIVTFPVFELNETTGNQAFGQAQVLDNFPISIQDGIYRWSSTGVRDERNAQMISQRVTTTLDSFTLTSVQTYDWEQRRELWVAYGKVVVVYNYQTDLWYKFALNDTIKTMIVIAGVMHFGTANGEIMKFDDAELAFNGVAVSAEWISGYYDWSAEWKRKFINYIYITMVPAPKANLDVYWITDRDNAEKQTSYSIGYNTFVYSQANYGTWTYDTNYSPRPKRIRTKAKKFAYYKLILRNSTLDYTSSVLGITFEARVGGDVK